MENEKRIAVFKAALEGVQASMDAHGHLVEPEEAWAFVIGLYEAEDDDAQLKALGNGMSIDRMPAEFEDDYRRLGMERLFGPRKHARI